MANAGQPAVRMKSVDEVVAQLAEIIHRHRRRYIAKHTRPCPANCAYADVSRKGVTGCQRCDSVNPEVCRQQSMFVALETKDEVAEQFRQDIRDLNVLRHEYRDVMTLLWVLGQLDGDSPEEEIIAVAEKRSRGGKRDEEDTALPVHEVA